MQTRAIVCKMQVGLEEWENFLQSWEGHIDEMEKNQAFIKAVGDITQMVFDGMSMISETLFPAMLGEEEYQRILELEGKIGCQNQKIK